jgi:hypothetical protein
MQDGGDRNLPRAYPASSTIPRRALRAFQRRVTIEPVDRNRWQIELEGAPTELVVTCLHENHWTVSKTSGEIIAGNCRSATEAESVAAHHLYLYGSPPRIEPWPHARSAGITSKPIQ